MGIFDRAASYLRDAFGAAAPVPPSSGIIVRDRAEQTDFAALAVAKEQRGAALKDSAQRADLVSFSEPSVRTFTDWTPEALNNARIQADAGTLLRAADLCEEMLGDDRVPSVLGTRANALFGSDLDFEDGTGARRRKAKRALEAEEDWWACFPEEELIRLFIWGIFLGVGLGELVWTTTSDKPGARLVCKLKVWHPRFLRWSWVDRCWYLRVDEYATEIRIEPGAGKWIFFTPYGRHRPWAYGLWRGMALLWLLKKFATKDWAQHSEVHGSPIRLGTIPAAAGQELSKGTTAARQQLAADLRNLGRDTTITLPTGFDFKLVEATARTWEMFQAQIQLANGSMSIMAIGSNLPTEVGGSAATGATAQTLVRSDYKKRDGETVATCTHDQALVFWARFNFGGDDDAAPWPRWLTDPPADTAALATTWMNVSIACMNFKTAGLEVAPAFIEATFGIEVAAAAALPAAPAAPDARTLPPAPAAPARKLAALSVHHASSAHRAVHEGQAMADAIADATRARAVEALGPLLADVERAVRLARGAADPKVTLRRELKALAAKAPPAELARLIEHATLLGVATGAWAQKQAS